MFRKILFICLLLITTGANAHSADTSTTMLVEKGDGTWVLQVSASLTAFQYEIRKHFADTPYKTPEEFREMVIEHVKNSIEFKFNGNQEIGLSKGLVVLGHETKVVFEVFGIPSDINSVTVVNKTFTDIFKNKSALMLLKEGFNKERFFLNEENNHTVVLNVINQQFVETAEAKASFYSYEMLLIVFALFGVLFLTKNAFKEKRKTSDLTDNTK